VIEESRFPTTKNAFTQKFKSLSTSYIAMEVKVHYRWSSQII